MSEPTFTMLTANGTAVPIDAHPRPDPHFAPVGEGPHCLCCQRALDWEFDGKGEKYNQVAEGGNLELWCHYGSRHDMMMGFDPSAAPLAGYLCDKCITRAKEAKLLR